jgi:hypothetical protein
LALVKTTRRSRHTLDARRIHSDDDQGVAVIRPQARHHHLVDAAAFQQLPLVHLVRHVIEERRDHAHPVHRRRRGADLRKCRHLPIGIDGRALAQDGDGEVGASGLVKE